MQATRRVITPLYLSIKPNRNKYAAELEASLAWSPEDARTKQNEKLAETLKWCLTEIPFYKDRVNLAPESITAETAEETLKMFPVLTATMVKAHFNELQCNPRPKSAFINRSGGTTGQPTVFYLDGESEDWVRGTKRYHLKGAGHHEGEPKWVIWGSPAEYQRRKRTKKARLAGWIVNSTWIKGFSLSTEDLDRILDRMQKESPNLVLAYTDIVDRLAERAEERNLAMHQNVKIMVTAGNLYTYMRERVERVFGKNLFNCYGSREFGDLALSCHQSDGLHIVGLSHYLEIADEAGNRLPDGETGDILVTSLVNRTMPLVRYAIKDRGSMTQKVCSCGNPWPRLEQVEGRSQDLFFAPDGRTISPNAMVHFCWTYGMEYDTRVQIVQKEFDKLEVHLLNNGKQWLTNEEFEAKMRWELETLFRVPLSIDIVWKDKMTYAPSGKYRMIRREME